MQCRPATWQRPDSSRSDSESPGLLIRNYPSRPMPNLAPTQALPEPVSPGYEWVQSSEEAMEQEEQSPAEPSLSEVTLVEVTLLGDLVRILSETTAHQRALAEQERLANAHRAALIEVQREAAKHHAALAEQQRIANAVAIRSELRMYNSSASHWQALPLLDGEPLPADVEFPKNFWHLKRMEEDAVRRLAVLYGVGDEESDVENMRANIRLYLTGRRS